MINGHGDDLHQYQVGIKYNFSSNVYYKGCSASLLKTLENSVSQIENYPSPSANELSHLASKHFDLDENQFLFTNGATEAFYLIAQNYRGQSATIVGPTFSEYEDACKINQVKHQFITEAEVKSHQFNSDLAFICNPNNPNGAILKTKEIEQLLNQFPQTHFIIDEAYIEFTNAIESSMPLIASHNNLSIVRSLTKTFAIPGMRLGYLVSNSNFISELLAIKMPWTVNTMAIEAGKYIFENYESLSFDISELLKETEEFKASIDAIDYLEVAPGFTTYFLVKLNKGTASELKKHLAESHQLLIRDATNFTTLQGEYIRLAVQSDFANKTLIRALKKWN